MLFKQNKIHELKENEIVKILTESGKHVYVRHKYSDKDAFFVTMLNDDEKIIQLNYKLDHVERLN